MSLVDKVAEFHRRHRINVGISLNHVSVPMKLDRVHNKRLVALGNKIDALAQEHRHGTMSQSIHPKQNTFDPRLLRAHLILEEAAEAMHALATRDEVELLDALADCVYVLAGTAATYGLPLDRAFDEVHRSNMTKKPREQRSHRVADKGPNYEPPNLEAVISHHLDETPVAEVVDIVLRCPHCRGIDSYPVECPSGHWPCTNCRKRFKVR